MQKSVNAKPKNVTVRNKTSLADALEIDPSQVTKMCARADWPFGQRGPFDATAIKQWRSENIRPPKYDSKMNTNVNAMRVALDEEKLALLRMQRESLESQNIRLSEHERILAEWAAEVREWVESLIETLPSLYPTVATTLRADMRARYDRWCEYMHGRETKPKTVTRGRNSRK